MAYMDEGLRRCSCCVPTRDHGRGRSRFLEAAQRSGDVRGRRAHLGRRADDRRDRDDPETAEPQARSIASARVALDGLRAH
jgi:hypothetical protein